MPIPTPNNGEQHDGFINRCMRDAVMQREYPNIPQRRAICEDSWNRQKNFLQQLFDKIRPSKLKKA